MLTLHAKLIDTPMMQAAIEEFAAAPELSQKEMVLFPPSKPRAARSSRKASQPVAPTPEVSAGATHEIFSVDFSEVYGGGLVLCCLSSEDDPFWRKGEVVPSGWTVWRNRCLSNRAPT
ncbi:MAG: hypothetical protein ACRYF2_16715 [Janthinobacterium lividum]